MNAHVSNIARTCYFELRRLASICRFLTSTVTATLVSAFVLSRIDYCNSLLFGSTHDVTSHLQLIQNSSNIQKVIQHNHTFKITSLIIIIMVIFKCYFSGELIALTKKKYYQQQQQQKKKDEALFKQTELDKAANSIN